MQTLLARTLAVLGVGLAAAAPTAHAADNVHLMLDFIPTGDYAPYYSGIANGIYEKHGIDLKITRGTGSGDTVLKVAGGAADIGLADISAILTSRQNSQTPIKAIASTFSHSAHSLFVLKDSGITNFSGLEGKKIAVSPGNSHKLYFPMVARKANTDPDKIQWVTVDGSSMAPLLINGKVDAAPFLATNYYYQNKQAKRFGKEIVVLPFSDQGFNIYALSVFTTDKTLAERPHMVQNFLNATIEAWDAARKDPDTACQAHVKANPEIDRDDCMGNLNAVLGYIYTDFSKEHGVGSLEEGRMKNTYEAVAEAQSLDPAWDYHQAYDTQFIVKANGTAKP